MNPTQSNWKTTTGGIIAAICGFIFVHPEYFPALPFVVTAAKFIGPLAVALLGTAAGDKPKQ
jgi:hypothetical protein